jgi:sphingosine kinase
MPASALDQSLESALNLSPSSSRAKEGTLPQHSLALTATELIYVRRESGAAGVQQQVALRLETLGGASVDGRNRLIVHSFPLESGCCGAARRKQVNTVFPCVSVAQAEEWRNAILQGLAGGDPETPLPVRKLLVLINPFSGRRKGRRNFQAVRHILVMRGAVLTEVETTDAGHAESLMQSFDPWEYDGVVIFSGDGLIYEVINGIMKRPDAEAALQQLPIGVVPSGSGNALAKQLTVTAGEPYDIVSSALIVAKGGAVPLDLAEVTQQQGSTAPLATPTTTWSFLAFMWGLVSDIDLESEACRCFGSARFDIYAALRLTSLRRYRGTLRHRMNANDPWTTVEGQFLMVWGTNVAWGSHDLHLAPRAELANGLWQLLYIQDASKLALIDGFLNKLGEGKACDCDFITEVSCTELQLEPEPRTVSSPGHIDVDGEEIPLGPTSLKVHQGLARVMCQPLAL